MATLLIDDLKTVDGVTKTVRTFEEGIAALQEQKWDVLYLDHDFGTTEHGKNGAGIMRWLEAHPAHLPGKIICVSLNGPGRAEIEQVVQKLYSESTMFSVVLERTHTTEPVSPETLKQWEEGCGEDDRLTEEEKQQFLTGKTTVQKTVLIRQAKDEDDASQQALSMASSSQVGLFGDTVMDDGEYNIRVLSVSKS